MDQKPPIPDPYDYKEEKAQSYNRKTKDKELSSIFQDFLSNTSAHGLPKVAAEKSISRKILWAIVFLGAMTYFSYQFSLTVKKYYEYPTVVKTRVLERKMVDFPAVTICNMNKLKRSLLPGTMFESLKDIDEGNIHRLRRLDHEVNENDKPPKRSKRSAGSMTKRKPASKKEIVPSKSRQKRQVPLPPPGGGDDLYDRPPPDEDSKESWGPDMGPYDGKDYKDPYGQDNNFEFEDNAFDGTDLFDFNKVLTLSRVSDYTDLVGIFLPTCDQLDELGHQKEDFIVQCSIDMKHCSHLDFEKVRNQRYGNCFVFNGHTGNSSSNATRWTTSKQGSAFGLYLTLNIEYNDYIGMFSPEAGVRVTIHPHNVTAFPEDYGVNAGPGMKTSIGMRLNRMERQKAPYQSNCSVGEGIPNIYKGIYTMQSCAFTCVHQKLLGFCGCTDKMVADNETIVCCPSNRTQELCRQRVYYLFDHNELGCVCPPQCLQLEYRTQVSTSMWPSEPYQGLMLSESLHSLGKEGTFDEALITVNAKENLVRVHIYFEEFDVMSIEEFPATTFEGLCANVGGLLGLFMGLSVCTAIEFVEFILDVAIFTFWRCRRKREQSNKIGSQTSVTKLN